MNGEKRSMYVLLIILTCSVIVAAIILTVLNFRGDTTSNRKTTITKHGQWIVMALTIGVAVVYGIFDVLAFNDVNSYLDLQGFLTNILGQSILIVWVSQMLRKNIS